MRIPLTSYGWPQVVVFPAALIAAIAAVAAAGGSWPLWAVLSAEAVLAALLVVAVAFFRDPQRPAPRRTGAMFAPADGTVVDIETVDGGGFIGRPAIRIGIFLSIFDPHVNRCPCAARVEDVVYSRGRHFNAASASSSGRNESNELRLTRLDEPRDRFVVRQISGAVARRIVCRAQRGQELASGQTFGMIKFGSRTELFIPAGRDVTVLVSVGDRVKAGVSAILKYNGTGRGQAGDCRPRA
jgi:phosphatidylserine decarboxylase